MNEIFDKLLIRIFLVLIVLACLVAYRYCHALIFSSNRNKIFKKYLPTSNPVETIHFFGHIIGISLVFSHLSFVATSSFLESLILFTLSAFTAFFLFLLSSWVMANINLYNFDYEDEIYRRKNYAFALVSFFQSLSCAIVIRQALFQTGGSFFLLLFIWLITLVILGLASKVYGIISTFNFQQLLNQKSLALAISYGGYMIGVSIILASSMEHEITDTIGYLLILLSKFILSWIIYPLFRIGLLKIFGLKRFVGPLFVDRKNPVLETSSPDITQGVFEGGLFFSCFFLTSMVLSRISFGNFYPTF